MGQHMLGNYNTSRLDRMIKTLEPKHISNAMITKPKLFHGKQREEIRTPAIDKYLGK